MGPDWPAELAVANKWWELSVRAGNLRPSTRARYEQVLYSFRDYGVSFQVWSVKDVTAALCERFVWSPLRGYDPTSGATARLRLTVLRSAFDVLVETGAVASNPTAGMQVSHTPAAFVPCPLTPPEVRRLLITGRLHPHDTLRPSTTALALCGARHSEIAGAVIADLDLESRLVRIGDRQGERRCPLPPEAIATFAARIVVLERAWRRRGLPLDAGTAPLALSRPVSTYPVNSVAPTVSGNLARALRSAGVGRPGIRPKSVREYAANALYARSGRIEAVAERLGFASFDAAAGLIDQGWQQRWGEAIRQETAHGD